MTTTTVTELELLRTRMAGAIGAQMPGHIERLGWTPRQLAGFQRDRLRALLARAIAAEGQIAAFLRQAGGAADPAQTLMQMSGIADSLDDGYLQ